MSNTTKSQSTKLEELSPAKRALLELRLKQQSRSSEHDTIPRRDPSKAAPLSYTQELLWLQHQISPSAAYNVPRALRIHGELDINALSATLRDLVLRHEVLRTRFVEVDSTPVQLVDEGVTPELEIIDLRMRSDEERENEVVKLIYDRASRLFDLAADTLLNTTLLQLGPQEHVLILVTHHIASDGWSRDVLFRELSELYEAHCTGRPSHLPVLPIQYADYAAWQRETLQGELLQKQLDYWNTKLEGAPELLALPIDFKRPTEQTFDGNTIRRHLLTKSELHSLKALGLEERATLFMTTLACAKIFLYRHTGQEDIVVGTPIVGRDRAETENLLGYFMNTLVLRTGLTADMTFREVLREVRRTTLGAFEHQNTPYVKVVSELNPERNPSYNPVFQVLFGFGQGASAPFTLSNLTVTPFAIDRGLVKFDLTISTSAVESGLLGALEYNTDLFTDETIGRMIDRLENVIRAVMADPDAPISRLPILNEPERKLLLADWNSTSVEYPPAATLTALFEAQVERTPSAPAVEFLGRTLTYAELNSRANQVAHTLRGCGVGPDMPVGILVERSDELIVNLLGILKSGGAYVPLDVTYPQERILSILTKSEAAFVVTQQAFAENLAGYTGHIVSVDLDRDAISEQSSLNPVCHTDQDNLAYIMFTSGSSGQPKGIAVPHSSLLHYVRASADVYGLKPADRILQFASICFDTSVEEIFPCLALGATLVVRDQAMLNTLTTFWRRCAEWGITVLSLPTAFWHELARGLSNESGPIPGTLRLIVIGGEKALTDRLNVWRAHAGPSVQLINTYGPTETTVVATSCDITVADFGEIPIGRPIPNVRIYLLDDHGQPVPRGVHGEIYIGGAGVARGYLNDAARTSEVFLPNPFVPGERMYRTGDLGRYRQDGNIEFLGRRDNQIKVRGFRIELGEIESVLGRHPQVGEAAVTAAESESGERRLVAYVTAATGFEVAESALRAYLHDLLPAYMVPHTFVVVTEFSKTPGGKIDRRALPRPAGTVRADGAGEPEGPQTASEEALVQIWQQVLGISRIGIDDNFFDLGGHSLLAIRLLSKIQGEFDAGLSLAEMFKAPTVRAMARLLRRKGRGDAAWSSLVPLKLDGDLPPLFCAPVGGGSAFYYRTLATHIGSNRPLYAFEPIGMNCVDEPHETVEAMAAYYVEQMRTVQPHGPYALCGLSFGGVVAYEMALQLSAAGEEIGALILFDTWAPGVTVKKHEFYFKSPLYSVGKLRYKIASYLDDLNARPTASARLGYVSSRIVKLEKRLLDRADGKPWRAPYVNPTSIDLPEAFQKVKAAEMRARESYRPDRYAGPILLLRARIQKPGLKVPPKLGWENLASNVVVIETPGTHFSMLEEPCVHISIAPVRKALNGSPRSGSRATVVAARSHGIKTDS